MQGKPCKGRAGAAGTEHAVAASSTEELMKNTFALLFALLGSLAAASRADAQLREGALRAGIDADVFSAGVVHEDPRGPAPRRDTTVVGVGPNLMGSSRAVIAMPQLGVSAAYALKPKWMLGARMGFGFDKVSGDLAASAST
jgi:hypothetical protein